MHPLVEIIKKNKELGRGGIYSCCSANEYVLRAALRRGLEADSYVLIEVTANQVDQYGGYTGMTPERFYAYMRSLADDCCFPEHKLILGGDHLGPLTFAGLPEKEAMAKAEELVRSYILAGFTKIHLDTSMKLADDPAGEALSGKTVAARGARLCAACEETFAEMKKTNPNAQEPVYIIGSEVPIPGGAQETEDALTVTKREAALTAIEEYAERFSEAGLKEAWERVVGLVVQPGVEFGDSSVFEYDRQAAGELSGALDKYPSMTFEAHSTDYQTRAGLRSMVEDGFAILKVGPALTFALREALFALSDMEDELARMLRFEPSNFRCILKNEMLSDNKKWKHHYHGSAEEIEFKLNYSYSDRARYYLPREKVNQALERLLKNLGRYELPLSLLSQYMPIQYTKVRENTLKGVAQELIADRIENCIDDYLYATGVGLRTL